jgi:hypothetical protein
MSTGATPLPSPAAVAAPVDSSQVRSSNKSHTRPEPVVSTVNSNSNKAKVDLHDLEPPKAAKIPTVVANYQSRWEREKAKARAEGTDIDGGDPRMIGPWVIGEMLGRGASGKLLLLMPLSSCLICDCCLSRTSSARPPLFKWENGCRQDPQSASKLIFSFFSTCIRW